MPERIQLRRTKGWRKPEGVVVVARPGPWGNPFRVSACRQADCRTPAAKHWHVHDSRRDMVALYLPEVLRSRPYETEAIAVAYAIDLFGYWLPGSGLDPLELAGRDLACWCPLDQPCHADVLLELANSAVGVA